MKTTDWRWNGSLLGIQVRRHNQWHIWLFGGRFRFQTAESPRWLLKIGCAGATWWPSSDKPLVWWLR